MPLPEEVRRLLAKRVFLHVATIDPDGAPHVTAVWAESDGEHILFNTAEGRRKPRNLRRDPRVGLSAVDPDDPYQAFTARGHVVEMTTEGADAHIDRLAHKYLGVERYPWRRSGEVRLTVRIAVDRIMRLPAPRSSSQEG